MAELFSPHQNCGTKAVNRVYPQENLAIDGLLSEASMFRTTRHQPTDSSTEKSLNPFYQRPGGTSEPLK
jgi:hypothetical protein